MKQIDSSNLWNPVNLVDTDRYPVVDPNTPAGLAFVQQCRQQFEDTGLCMLPGFIRPEAQSVLAAQANAVADRAYYCDSSHNAYLNDALCSGDASPASGHQEQTCVGSVAYDDIGQDSMLRQLYLWDPLKDFVGAVLGKEKLYRFSDPSLPLAVI